GTLEARMTLEPGTQLDRYTIEAFLGEGAMGKVYRAFDARLERAVAIKVLAPVAVGEFPEDLPYSATQLAEPTAPPAPAEIAPPARPTAGPVRRGGRGRGLGPPRGAGGGGDPAPQRHGDLRRRPHGGHLVHRHGAGAGHLAAALRRRRDGAPDHPHPLAGGHR